jgi:hypothetical protein
MHPAAGDRAGNAHLHPGSRAVHQVKIAPAAGLKGAAHHAAAHARNVHPRARRQQVEYPAPDTQLTQRCAGENSHFPDTRRAEKPLPPPYSGPPRNPADTSTSSRAPAMLMNSSARDHGAHRDSRRRCSIVDGGKHPIFLACSNSSLTCSCASPTES